MLFTVHSAEVCKSHVRQSAAARQSGVFIVHIRRVARRPEQDTAEEVRSEPGFQRQTRSRSC